MIEECLIVKMVVEKYLQMMPDALPNQHFRFATFENDDYRRGNLTLQLYNYIPDSVFFSRCIANLKLKLQ